MKLLIYSEYFLPIPGGVQTIVLGLARGLAAWKPEKSDAEAIEVTLVTRTQERMEEDMQLPFRLVRTRSFRALTGLMREADIIHLAGPAMLPLILGLGLRKRVVIEHHGFQVSCPNGLLFFEPSQTPCPGYFMAGRYEKCIECNRVEIGLPKSWYWLMLTNVRRWLANRVAINIVPTAWLGTVLKLKRMRTVHHGISPTVPAKSGNPLVTNFAYQGRLVTAKGIGVFLEAVERLRADGFEFKLKIIGDGSQETALKARMPQILKEQVEFLGHLPDDKLEEALAETATVVMPSLGGEVFGLVAAENMLRGKLLIVSDIGALKEVVGETGLVFPTGDADQLAARMRQVLENPSLARSLGAEARVRAMQAFDRDSMIERHISVYREALSR